MKPWITGMALNTPLGDQPADVLNRMIAGHSGITAWSAFPPPPLAPVIGGDLSHYDITAKTLALSKHLPKEVYQRLQKMMRRLPWSFRLSLLVAAEAALQVNWWGNPVNAEDVAVLCVGHNLNARFAYDNWLKFEKEPDYIDALLAVHMLDTTHAACVSELLGSKGEISTIGASCASGNMGLRAAMDLLADGASVVMLVAPIYDYAPSTFHSLGLMGATTEAPIAEATLASRPFDRLRSGFVPSHGLAALVLERPDHAQGRGQGALAQLLSVEAASDACHRPPRPDPVSQVALIHHVLEQAHVLPAEVGLISAHAASTPAGDKAEAEALLLALKGAAVPINAPKSMLGHCGWSSALIETVLAIAQIQRGAVHGTLNSHDALLPLVEAGSRPVKTVLNNAFGFGGLGCISLIGAANENV